MMKPIDPIAAVFRQKPPALMPYYTLGYPDLDTSIEIIERCAAAGAPLMELGIPFSDPLADGPTIQHSTQVALEKGITVAQCLAAVRQLRRRGVEIPFLLMGSHQLETHNQQSFFGSLRSISVDYSCIE